MRRLRSNSRKNRIYKVFREVGRSVRTVALLRYLADPQLRARITAATNKVESYNGFSHWLGFGNNGILASNDPAEQEKQVKLNTLHEVLPVPLDELPVDDVAAALAEQRVDVRVDEVLIRAEEDQVLGIPDPGHQVEPEQGRQGEDPAPTALACPHER